jgi:pimeloyl-ACP methyl ester carboxylesterase
MSLPTHSGYIALNAGKLSFRMAGDGPVLVLLHASPLSSASMLPLLEVLKTNFCVIAFDTPGYGDSATIDASSLADYADAIARALAQLNIARFTLYGVATGAQIALTYAKRYPDQLQQLYMDGACHFENAQREAILQGYFPDLTPVASGAHLTWIWHIVNALFEAFPWFSEAESERLTIQKPPLSVLHQMALDYWRAGPDARAYRMAFANEHAIQFASLQVPCALLRRADSLLLRYTDALIAQPLPSCVKVIDIAPGAERFAAMAAAFLQNRKEDCHHAASDLLARTHPAQLAQALTPEELPAELAPTADGAHLLRAWQLARGRAMRLAAPISIDAVSRAALSCFFRAQ